MRCALRARTGRSARSGAVGGRGASPRPDRATLQFAGQSGHFDRCTIAAALASHRRLRRCAMYMPASCTNGRSASSIWCAICARRSDSVVLLYDGGEQPELLTKGFPFEKHGALICPGARPMRWGYLHGFALDCMRFALGRSALRYLDHRRLGPARHAEPDIPHTSARFCMARKRRHVSSSRDRQPRSTRISPGRRTRGKNSTSGGRSCGAFRAARNNSCAGHSGRPPSSRGRAAKRSRPSSPTSSCRKYWRA